MLWPTYIEELGYDVIQSVSQFSPSWLLKLLDTTFAPVVVAEIRHFLNVVLPFFAHCCCTPQYKPSWNHSRWTFIFMGYMFHIPYPCFTPECSYSRTISNALHFAIVTGEDEPNPLPKIWARSLSWDRRWFGRLYSKPWECKVQSVVKSPWFKIALVHSMHRWLID